MFSPEKPQYRPINLLAFRFPLNAWLSILHRITGGLLLLCLIAYLLLANLIWLNQEIRLSALHNHWLLLSLHTLFWSSLMFHWLSGVRHLLAETLYDKPAYLWLGQSMSQRLMLGLWLFLSLGLAYQIWH
ncbi:MAG: succinate dehydrogenase, cytochrome b556 subunit [Thiotrichales bacterium]|nr:succinate dehydrogenase, cytochrome b556 subunit [Thiotrichales bacterium]